MKRAIQAIATRALISLTIAVVVFLQTEGPERTFAAPGALLQTVNVPAAAQCTSGIGTSVTIVPGSMIGLFQIPILLVTSCYSSQTSSLYFMDPSTNPATLVNTINTSPTPPNGWGAISLRGDKGDLLACGNDATAPIYAIDVSPYNAIPDGTATFLFNGVAFAGICDGVAWDTGDNTIFQSPDVYHTIYHYSETGTLLGSFASPCSTNSGLAVGGASLFAACNGTLTIYQLDKTSGAVFTSFPTAGTRTEDLQCDPVTFAASSVDAMWSKDAFTNQLFAFEIPAGTCGFAGGPPVVPAACPGGDTTDTDEDGLLDCWETDGIDWDGDGTIDLELYDVDGDGTIQASEDADPNHKDMYLEIDYMALHQPGNNPLNDVIAAFAAAPVANPDATTGIRLHLQVDEQALVHNDNLAFEPCTGAAGGGTPDFDTTKDASWGTAAERANANSVKILNAKRFISRYTLFVHNLLGTGASGCAELPGNDFVVSLGWYAGGHQAGTRDHKRGTLMHEFGHNLNLRHGGGDNINCKPNYLSVMSYSRQFNTTIPTRPLDYSPAALAALNEGNLNEPAGIGGPAGSITAYGPLPILVVPGDQPINWNRNAVSTDVGAIADINSGFSGCGANAGQNLTGYDDWANLEYKFQATIDFADGVHLSAPSSDEITLEEAVGMPGDFDGDGCTSDREAGLDETLGGRRDPLNPWDFYDVAIAGGVQGQDQQIDLFNDIVGVIDHYAPTGLEPAYDVWYDRGPSEGPNVWNLTAPDGRIDLFNDIVGVIDQFGHDCR